MACAKSPPSTRTALQARRRQHTDATPRRAFPVESRIAHAGDLESMKLADFFITRPIFAGVLSSIILIAGLIALPNLPISEYPEVVPPTVVVKASYPGANP